MPTKIEKRYPDGQVKLVDRLFPKEFVHAFSLAESGIVCLSFVIQCREDDIEAVIFKPSKPELIVRPLDHDVVEDLCDEDYLHLRVLRGSRPKELPMTDHQEGPYTLIVNHLVELGPI